ncbi:MULTISPECIES: acyltransferase family protein [unclassified Paenibacillus]|uniref:acyltransferase family protein n=1 Tax=unclassified Paenibacillus TaxID=185978 RepID=UPI003639699D
MKTINTKYLPGTDHLRAFAAFLIIMYHSSHRYTNIFANSEGWIIASNPVTAMIFEGHTAVALFMVLSGFIFTYGMYDKEIKYLSFIRNRLLRIYPLFVFLLFISIYIYKDNASFLSVIQILFQFQDIHHPFNQGVFTQVFWAISVEFQFYLVFPFLLVFLQKYGVKYIVYVILLMVVFRLSIVLLNVETSIRDLSYWTIIGRFDQFLIGMISAVLFIKSNNKKKLWFYLLMLSIFILGITIWVFNNLGGWPVESDWKIIWPTIEGLVWALFLVAYNKVFLVNSNAIQKFLSKIGDVSYSMYLLHVSILTICLKHQVFFHTWMNATKSAMLNSLLIVIPASILISFLTFNIIEKPFLELRKKYTK